MERDIESDLKQWELFKSYGEFNLLFEDSIQSLRILLISLIRLSYNYSEDEDDEGNELEDEDQDRLVKILMQNMGAMEILASCKACFVDFFEQQKRKYRAYRYYWNDTTLIMSDFQYDFSIEVFKQCRESIQLRNVLIHSHYYIPYMHGIDPVIKLQGSKDLKMSKGYEKRKYEFDIEFLIRVNKNLDYLRDCIMAIKRNIYIGDGVQEFQFMTQIGLNILKSMDFSIPIKM